MARISNGSRRAQRAAAARERAELQLRAHAVVIALGTRRARHLRHLQLVTAAERPAQGRESRPSERRSA
jgi:hypothetical protein